MNCIFATHYKKWREGEKLFRAAVGGGSRSCTSVDAEMGQGEQRGSVFSVCTGGAAVLGSFLQYGGVMQGYA